MSGETIQQSTVSPTKETTGQTSITANAGAKASEANTTGTTEQKKSFDAQKFATLARREKLALEAERRAKSEVEKSTSLTEKYNKYEQALMDGKKDPLKFIKEHFGYDYQDITAMQLNDGRPTDNMELKSIKSEMEQWKEAQARKDNEFKEAQEKARLDAEQAEQKAQIDSFKTAIPEKLSKLDKVDLVTALLEPHEQSDKIFDIIEQHWLEQEGKKETDPAFVQTMLSVEDAADILEKALTEEFTTKVSKSKKFGDFIKQANAPAAPAQDKKDPKLEVTEQAPPGFAARTLTSEMAASAGNTSMVTAATDNDRMKRALAAMQGK